MKKQLKLKCFLLFFLPQLVLFCFMIATSKIRFATNDDTTMVAIAGGAYGWDHSQYLINMSIGIGYLLKFFFTHFPGVNWLTVFFLTCMIFSFALIDSVLARRLQKNSKSSYLFLVSGLLLISFYLFLFYFTFTVVSYAICIAGAVSLLFYLENRKRLMDCIIGVFCFILSVMVRTDCIIAIAVILTPYLVIKAKQQKRISLVLLPIICAVTFLSVTQINDFVCRLDPVQAKFMDWGEARSKAMDSAPIDFETHQQELSESGIDVNGYYAMYYAFYYDHSVVSQEAFEKISQIQLPSEKYNFQILQFFKDQKDALFSCRYENLQIVFFWLLFILLTALNRKKWMVNCSIFLTVYFCNFIFFFIRRAPYRVAMPTFIFGCLLLIFENRGLIWPKFAVSKKQQLTASLTGGGGFNFSTFSTTTLNPLLLSFVMILSGFSFYLNNGFTESWMVIHDERNSKVLDYLETHNDQLFLAGNPACFIIDVNRSAFDYAGKNGLWNLIGNWEIYSLPYFDLVGHYPVEHPDRVVLDLPNNEHLRIMVPLSDTIQPYVVQNIESAVGEPVTPVLVDTITDTALGDFNIYKIVT